MTPENRFLQLLEAGEATVEDAVAALETFERDLTSGEDVETSTCQFCGKTYVVSAGDRPVVAEQGRRSVCWRRACRQELRARGLRWAGHHLYRRSPPSGALHAPWR